MTDMSASDSGNPNGPQPPRDAAYNDAQSTGSAPERAAFPWVRLAYSAGFALVAWFVFWIALVLAAGRFILIALKGDQSGDYQRFVARWIAYLAHVVAFVALEREDKPFPLGPLPDAQR